MKIVNNKILTVIFSAMAIFALSGCGSSGTSSGDELVGGTPVTPPVAGTPVVTAPYEITAHHDSTVVVHSHVTPSATGDEHAHEWTQVSGPTVALTTPTGSTTTLVVPTGTTQPIVLQHTVTNVQTGQATVTQHTVNPIPAIPQTKPLSLVVSTHDDSVKSGSKASLHASVSGGDGHYTYAWTQTGGTAVLSDPTLSAPTFTAPIVTKIETLTFSVMVTDGQGATKSATETITVNPLPVAPAPLSVSISGVATMPASSDGGLHCSTTGGTVPMKFAWSVAPAGVITFSHLLDTPTDSAINIHAESYDAANSSVTVTCEATDKTGHTETATHNLSIYDVPPVALLSVTATVSQSVDVNKSGILSAHAQGGTPPYTYAWHSAPVVQIANPHTAHTSFTAPTQTGKVVFWVRVIDFDGNSDTSADAIVQIKK